MKRSPKLLLCALILVGISSCNEDPPTAPSPEPVDYFPLKLGNKWTYAFSNFHSEPPGYGNPGIWKETYDGTSLWEIDSVNSGSKRSTYFFTETINGTWIQTWNPPWGTDSTRISNGKIRFVVSDSSNVGALKIGMQFYAGPSGNTSPNAYVAGHVLRLGVQRFLADTTSVDTTRYIVPDGQIISDHVFLVRSIGVCRFGRYHRSMSTFQYQATLQSYQLK